MADTDNTKTSDQSKKTQAKTSTTKSGTQATGPTNEVTSSTNPESSGGAAATPATASSVSSGEASQTETQNGSDSAKSGTESGSQPEAGSADQPGDKTGASVAADSAVTDPVDTTAADQAAKDAVQVVIDNAKGEDKATVQKRVDEALVNAGVDTQPTMVNGRSVVGKKLNDAGDEWVDDPDYAGQAGVRAEDIFDRIGNAFPHEPQRLVIEELARIAGATAESTVDLPEGQPTLKSTASLRTDVSGYGRNAGGRGVQGGVPVAPGRDGKAQVENSQGDSES